MLFRVFVGDFLFECPMGRFTVWTKLERRSEERTMATITVTSFQYKCVADPCGCTVAPSPRLFNRVLHAVCISSAGHDPKHNRCHFFHLRGWKAEARDLQDPEHRN